MGTIAKTTSKLTRVTRVPTAFVLNTVYLYKSMLFLRKDVFLEVVENSQHVLVIINLLLEQLLDQGKESEQLVNVYLLYSEYVRPVDE